MFRFEVQATPDYLAWRLCCPDRTVPDAEACCGWPTCSPCPSARRHAAFPPNPKAQEEVTIRSTKLEWKTSTFSSRTSSPSSSPSQEDRARAGSMLHAGSTASVLPGNSSQHKRCRKARQFVCAADNSRSLAPQSEALEFCRGVLLAPPSPLVTLRGTRKAGEEGGFGPGPPLSEDWTCKAFEASAERHGKPSRRTRFGERFPPSYWRSAQVGGVCWLPPPCFHLGCRPPALPFFPPSSACKRRRHLQKVGRGAEETGTF